MLSALLTVLLGGSKERIFRVKQTSLDRMTCLQMIKSLWRKK